ncbi:GyrI-like domain-containing protein [Halobacteriota archaeon]
MKKQEITIVDLPVQYVLGLRERGKYQEKIPDMIKRLFEYLRANNIKCTGAPVFVCRETAEEAKEAEKTGNADIEIAVPVPEDTSGNDEQGIKAYTLEGGPMAKTIHKGPYEECGPSYERLFKWIAENGKVVSGPTREIYLNDPRDVKTEEILTEIYAPIEGC